LKISKREKSDSDHQSMLNFTSGGILTFPISHPISTLSRMDTAASDSVSGKVKDHTLEDLDSSSIPDLTEEKCDEDNEEDEDKKEIQAKLNLSRSSGGGGLCKVCGDAASGMYFGALVCVPCKVS